jgi:hypothetical protein
MARHLRKLLAGTAALVSLLAFSAPALAQGGGVTHAGKVTAHAAKRHHHHRRHHSRIPQHNGGDHDADNNGGPSDGDGNI